MRSAILALLATTGFLWIGGAQDASAQVGISVEGRLAVTVPVGRFADDDPDTGLATGGEVAVHWSSPFSAYVSFSRHTFNCEADCLLDDEFRSTGVGAGVRYVFPSPADALLWTRAGLVGRRSTLGAASGDVELGFELGAGIDMLVARELYVVPHLAYQAHDGPQGLRASYFTFGAGLNYRIR